MNPDIVATALAAAREAAAAAAEVIRHYWRRGVEVELKSDATPVTIADREAEQAIRRVLQAALPQASIYGEEFGLDGNPENGAATGKVRSRLETVGADQALVITLPVRDGASFLGNAPAIASVAADGVDYEIGGSNDLLNFDQTVSELVPALTGPPDMPFLNTGWTYRTFRLDGAVGGGTPRGPKGFLRAKVAATPTP